MTKSISIAAATRLLPVLVTALSLFTGSVSIADDWQRLDTITITERDHTRNIGALFDGRLDRVSFRARDRAVRCNMIRINFLNGSDQEIRNRRFPRGDRVAFNLDGNNRHITHIHFNCEPVGRGRGPAEFVISGK